MSAPGAKKQRLQTSKDPEVWIRWYEELSSGEESPLDEEDESEVEEDTMEKSNHETYSEQEVSSDKDQNMTEKNLTYVETMRKDKRKIPNEFLPKRNKEEQTSLFGFQEKFTMVSYGPKKNKAVILISSINHDNAIDHDSGQNKKPEIISFYNQTKIGVNLVDQMHEKYNVARNTNRLPMVIFYANNSGEKVLRNDFIKNFAWKLIKPQIEYRSAIASLPRELRRPARVLLGVEEVLLLSSNRPENIRMRYLEEWFLTYPDHECILLESNENPGCV
ncbi:hypothetical protein ILUMI_18272 [Ignelater luminosus]|uniref:PiggyBac transposable element-derived protein domain-containing protein n=1 Tax=Ignelater luminosus TaxID=2038154 RepID=A0A8K0CLM4_IGNLU|nr:hypothetical protein ILUMI_18272 [Ignelater luminosus]